MGKVIFLFLFWLSSSGYAGEIVAKGNSLQQTAAHILNADPKYIRVEISTDSKNSRRIALCHHQFECGQGTCTHAVFLETGDDSYRYSGMIEGVLNKIQFKSKTDPVIQTTVSAGAGSSQLSTWHFNSKDRKYEAR